MSKEKWKRPKLVVLLRGRPEERILSYCKIDGPPYGSGPSTVATGCIEGGAYPESSCEDAVCSSLGTT